MTNSKRKQITKSVRFEIFKRDDFTCQYCGAHPPHAILHVDHINPVKSGGTNRSDNLVTSCESCNQGKAARLLSDIPQNLKDKAEETKDRELQIQGYNDVFLAKRERIEGEAWKIVGELTYGEKLEGYPRKDFLSIKRFLESLPFASVLDAAEIASANADTMTVRGFKYFAAICWRYIRESEKAS